MTETLGNFLANLTFAYFLSFSLLIIIFDVMLLTGVFLFPIAFASILSGFWSQIGLSPEMQVWALPANIALGIFLQMRFLKKPWFKKAKLPSEKSEDLIGATASIVSQEASEESNAYFYGYKENITTETAPTTTSELICKVKLEDGSLRPLAENGADYKDGEKVRIIGLDGYAVRVEKI